MRYLLGGFRRFVEEMDPSAEKTAGEPNDSKSNDYFDTIEDEFGIKWKSLKDIIASEPYVSTHFMLGKSDNKIAYKASTWEIDPDSITEHGAYIRIKPFKGMRTYLKGNKINTDVPDTNKYYVTREELLKLLTTAWVPPAPPPGGDMGGGPLS